MPKQHQLQSQRKYPEWAFPSEPITTDSKRIWTPSGSIFTVWCGSLPMCATGRVVWRSWKEESLSPPETLPFRHEYSQYILWVRRKLDQSARPDHICCAAWMIQLCDLYKLKWYLGSSTSCICNMWWNHLGGEVLKLTVLFFFFFLPKTPYVKK